MKKKTRMFIGKHLRDLRKQHHLKQKDIAEYLGIVTATYSLYETDKSEPSLGIVIALADFYETTTDNILGL